MATLRSPKSTCRERQLLYFFPYEIIVEILLRLPVKSLLRFRCVCKSWCSQFSHPDFIKKHLDLLTKEDSLEKWRMVLCNSYLSIKTCPLYSIYREFANAAKIEYPLEKAGYRVRIIGSCNGLVCFHGENEEHIVYLWNPATRESKEILPALSFGRKFCPIVTYGFGYNEFNDDYKVVQISLKAVRFKIYSLRTNSWKLTWDFCYQPVSNESGNFVNGALNWLMTRREGQVFFMVLVSFNLKEETFQETPLPSCGTGVVKWMLRVLGGCICILCDKETCLDVWMIKEYGVAASWTKFVTIQYAGCLKSLPPPRSFCILKYGTILIYFGETLVLYNIEEKTCKFPVIYGAQYCYEADIYLESLVSPHAYERFISWKLIKE